MNQFKNTIILILSVIIVVQAMFLVYFMHRASSPVPVKVERPVTLEREGAPRPGAASRETKNGSWDWFVWKRAPVKPAAPAPAPEKERVPVIAPVETPAPVRPVAGRIVLILDDWGNSLKHRDFITDNDIRITLAILPFKPLSPVIAKLAHDKGKCVIIHMPMEPHQKERYDLEENTLMTRMNGRTITRLLDEAYKTVPYATGISNHMGSAATEDPALMRTVMLYLKARGAYFLDSYVTAKSVGRATARKIGVPYVAREIFIDNEADPVQIRQQMLKLAESARTKGTAIGIGHDRSATIAVLKEIIPELEAEGFQFVGLDDAVRS